MPAKLQTAIQVPSDNVPNYDEVVITSINTPIHFNGDGNVEVGDALEVDENGDYIKEEKYAIHYLLLLAGVIVYKGHSVLEGQDLLDAMGRNPNARNEAKSAAYDVLSNLNVIPTGANIT